MWPIWLSCPCCDPSQLLAHPQPSHCGGKVRKSQYAGVINTFLVTVLTPHHTCCYEENELHLIQTHCSIEDQR